MTCSKYEFSDWMPYENKYWHAAAENPGIVEIRDVTSTQDMGCFGPGHPGFKSTLISRFERASVNHSGIGSCHQLSHAESFRKHVNKMR